MDDLTRKRWMIGLHSCLVRTPLRVGEAVIVRGDESLFNLPVLPSDLLHASLEYMREMGYRGGRLATAWSCAGEDAPYLIWLDTELVEPGGAHEDSHLRTTSATTVGEVLRITPPGTSWTIQLGSERLKVRLWPETEPITDPEAVELLSDVVPA